MAAIAIAAVVASGSALLASPSVSMGDTGASDKVYWSDRQAPFMYGTDEATIHAGDRFDVKDSRYRVQVRDFEDGDVTSDIRVVSNGVKPDIPGDYRVKVMDKYDSMLGVSIRADNPLDQRVRTKYFCRANVNGFGGAYYNGGDHVGIHNANMWLIFEYN